MEAPADAFARLLDSPLLGKVDGPVERDGAPLRGITKRLHERYGGGHLTKRRGRSSARLGQLVHREVREWFFGAKRPPAPHAWTEIAVEKLAERGLIPVGAEVPIAHGPLGTRADLIARRAVAGPRYALVSLKTGTRRGPDAGPRRGLPAPFADLKRCERTLDDLQVAAERGIARRGHDVTFDAAYVLEVPEGVLREAPAWTADEAKQDALIKDLAA